MKKNKIASGILMTILILASSSVPVFARYSLKAETVSNEFSIHRKWGYTIIFDSNKDYMLGEDGDATSGWLYENFAGGEFDVTGTMDDEDMIIDNAKPLYENEFYAPGYAFVGWNTQPNGEGESFYGEVTDKGIQKVSSYVNTSSTKYHKSEKIISDKAEVINLSEEINGVVTLYAQWEVLPYTLHYDANTEGYGLFFNGVMSDNTFEPDTKNSGIDFNQSVKLDANQFNYPAFENEYGGEFVGWSLTPTTDLDLKVFDDEEENVTHNSLNIYPGQTEVTIYALWNNVPTPYEEGYCDVVLDATNGKGAHFEHVCTDSASNKKVVIEKGDLGSSLEAQIYLSQGTVLKPETPVGENGYEYYCNETMSTDGPSVEEYFRPNSK